MQALRVQIAQRDLICFEGTRKAPNIRQVLEACMKARIEAEAERATGI
jgi:hypothetical protein